MVVIVHEFSLAGSASGDGRLAKAEKLKALQLYQKNGSKMPLEFTVQGSQGVD